MNKTFNTIFLIGYMGAGKSVIGKSLSKKINYKFYDLDDYIEIKEGKKVSDIFDQENEVYFRKIENKYLDQLSSKKEKKIISTGGGTPCFDNNLDIILNSTNSLSIYLKANVNTLVKRLKNSIAKRPLISHLKDDEDLRDFVSKHLFERSFFYEKSDVKIITDDIEVNFAHRHDDYSDFGSADNSKLSLRWQAMDNLVVRTSYSESFIAPTLDSLNRDIALSISQPAG